MDYEFLRDMTGEVKVTFSMGHEVFGHWFNEEVKGDFVLLDSITAQVDNLMGSEREWQWIGHEYTLLINAEEIMIRANQLNFTSDSLEEGMSYYDEESLGFCGVEDFLAALQAYRQFYLESH